MNPIESIRSSITASRALCAAATPGPWATHDHKTIARRLNDHGEEWVGYAWVGYDGTCGLFQGKIADLDRRRDGCTPFREAASADADFIAHARQALPAHVDALSLAVAALEKCNAKVKQYEATQPEHDSYYAGPTQMRDWGLALQEVYELPDSINAALAKIAERLKENNDGIA